MLPSSGALLRLSMSVGWCLLISLFPFGSIVLHVPYCQGSCVDNAESDN